MIVCAFACVSVSVRAFVCARAISCVLCVFVCLFVCLFVRPLVDVPVLGCDAPPSGRTGKVELK